MDPARQRQVALGLAAFALALAVVATIVVVARSGGTAAPAAAKDTPPPATPAATAVVVEDHDLTFDVLQRIGREYGAFEPARGGKGVRLRDADLASKLGLEADDTIVAWGGRPCDDASAARMAAMRSGFRSEHLETLYIEVVRAGKPVLVRDHVTDAQASTTPPRRFPWTDPLATPPPPSTSPTPSYPPPPPPPPTPIVPSTPDPLAASIDQIDETHAAMSRATRDRLLSDPAAVSRSARIVPSVKNGQADGFKLYAIRPDSVASKLNLQNGDTVHALNGTPLTTADQVLELYTKLRDVTKLELDITRRGRDMTLTITVR